MDDEFQRLPIALQLGDDVLAAAAQFLNGEAVRAVGVAVLGGRVVLDARDAQIRKLQDSLNAKQTERGTLVTFGDVLFDFNKIGRAHV